MDISLSTKLEKIARGSIELTVGDIQLNDDGRISDGIADDITYNYHKRVCNRF